MNDDERQASIGRYRKRWEEFGYDPRTLGWTKGSQTVRFAALAERLGPEIGSVIDVGCGFGDLLPFLRARGFVGRYTGVDLQPEFIDEARRRHGGPDVQFLAADIVGSPEPLRADAVVAIGIFNQRVADNPRLIDDTLGAMWRMTEVVMVADFLSATADAPAPQLYYADAGEILRQGLVRSRRAALHHDYMPFEFQLAVWRDDRFTSDAPVFGPYLPHRS